MAMFRKAAWWLPVGFAFNDVFAGFHFVSGDSMSPTLNPPESVGEDVILIDRLSFRLYRYQRGEVVVLRSPTEPNRLLIRRVIGLEGDWVQVPSSSSRDRIEQIPKGSAWVDGDNPSHSKDAITGFGSVPLALLQGRAIAICWPPNRWGKVDARVPSGRLISCASGRYHTRAAEHDDGRWT